MEEDNGVTALWLLEPRILCPAKLSFEYVAKLFQALNVSEIFLHYDPHQKHL